MYGGTIWVSPYNLATQPWNSCETAYYLVSPFRLRAWRPMDILNMWLYVCYTFSYWLLAYDIPLQHEITLTTCIHNDAMGCKWPLEVWSWYFYVCIRNILWLLYYFFSHCKHFHLYHVTRVKLSNGFNEMCNFGSALKFVFSLGLGVGLTTPHRRLGLGVGLTIPHRR
jgi:hypothetical protein